MNSQIKTLLCCFSILLSACTQLSTPYNDKLSNLYLDHAFMQTAELESPAVLFAASPEIKQYVADNLSQQTTTKAKIHTLLSDLFASDGFNIQYAHYANYSPTRTIEAKSANCLSLTLLAYVIATEAGLNAEFMSVDVPENWNTANGMTLLNGHVNLRVSKPRLVQQQNNKIYYAMERSYTIDFLPMLAAKTKRQKPLTKVQMQALFYNNKGAYALSNRNLDLAYQYFKQATVLAPDLTETWGNLASLYRQTGHIKEAERIYLAALNTAPMNLNLMQNLSILYRFTGRIAEANQLAQKVKKSRENNPFYHAMLGEEALIRGELNLATAAFHRAIKLERKEHSFYFGLAKIAAEEQNLSKAQHYLRKAQALSKDSQTSERYGNKLALLKNGF